MKCNKTQSKWCKNKHGASKIIDTFETYQCVPVKSHPTSRGHESKPHVVNGQRLKHYIAGKIFVGKL
jgi:hypothetical protein